MCMTQQDAYAVMDVDRNTIVTSGTEMFHKPSDGGQRVLIAQEGQNVFPSRERAELFRGAHMDSDGFGAELVVVELSES